MLDASGSTAYCYDRFGQLVRKVQTTNGHAFTLRYGYSVGGRLQTVTYPDGAKVDYLRNALGQISQVGLTRAGGTRQIIATQITYAPFGPVTGWTDGGGRVLTRAHNLNYQPQSVRDAGAGGLDLAFEYDPAGNLNLLKNGTGVAVAQYGYDALNRLTQTKDGPTGTPIETYGYDKTGNRTSLIKAGVTTAYAYPAASHRLSNVGGVNRGYSAAGNLTSIGSTQRQFTYNNANRLSTAKANGVTTGSYRYNGKGELVRQYLSTTNTYSLHDEAGHWLGDYSTPSSPRQQAIWLDDLPIGVLTGAGAGQTVQYLQPDHLGSPRVAIDAIRNKAIWTWDLKGEAFGNTPPHQDPDGDGQAFVLNLRYPGQRYDAATGLNYNYFRDYEPGTGRYVQSDPVGMLGGLSTYGYASQRPLSLVDPKGLLAFGPTCNAQMRAAIIQAVIELSNEITSKANSAAKNCEKGDCEFSLAGDVMRNVSAMTFSCDNTFLCAQTLINGVAYYHPTILTAPKASEILKPGQCGCLKGTIFHEATHQARWDMSENEVRRKTLDCVSCAQNVNEHGGPL